MARCPLPEQRVLHHCTQRRGDRHGDPYRGPFGCQPLEDTEQRQVGLDDCLVKPVLLEKVRVLRVPHIWQMCVQQEGELTFSHRGHPKPDRLVRGAGT